MCTTCGRQSGSEGRGALELCSVGLPQSSHLGFPPSPDFPPSVSFSLSGPSLEDRVGRESTGIGENGEVFPFTVEKLEPAQAPLGVGKGAKIAPWASLCSQSR